METVKIKLSKLKSNTGQVDGLPKNPRFIKDEKFEKLVKSIKEDPEMLNLREVLAYDTGTELVVIAGNMRLKACKELGIKEVPCKILPTDTPLQKLKAYTIKDNVSFGEHDFDLLREDWDLGELESWGIDMPVVELSLEAEDDDFVGVAPSEPITVPGDFYEIGPHRLYCASSTETDTFVRLMGGELADMVVTDPPYNVNYEGGTGLKIMNDSMSDSKFYQFLYDFYTALNTVVRPGGAWYVWHADSEGANFRRAMTDAGILLKQCLIWVKSSIVLGRQDYHWKHEPCLEGATNGTPDMEPFDAPAEIIKEHMPILYGWKEGAAHKWFNDRKQSTVLEFEKPKKNGEHPTMKPVELIGYQIKNNSLDGEIVADGFLGSGTTMVASHQLGRKCYGNELDPKYCDVIVARMLKVSPTIPIIRNGALLSEAEKEKFIKNTNS